MLIVWLVLVFVLGAAVGSFLNVCIYRVPLEKSVFWPGSRCGHCYQPIRWYDNIPLVSYWLLHGRCRRCKTPFSSRYFLIELLTGASFAGLFYLEVIVNVHHFPRSELQNWQIRHGVIPAEGWVVFGFHAVLVSFLIVATFCDLDRREIPLAVTAPGTVIGLVGSVLWPWPWPNTAFAPGTDATQPWWRIDPHRGPHAGLYPWPFWGPLPDGLAPGGNWQTGLATGLAGVLVGTFMLRAIRFLFSKGLGVEALGLGDADLMMMAGAFLGWQPVVLAFFVSVVPALVIGVIQVVVYGDNSLPFGPSLALGVVITWLGWHWIGPPTQIILFNGPWMAILAISCGVFMLAASYLIRLGKLSRQ
jgi:leader peptidase (prepilin peptidase)/N-methyltransferase